MLYPLPLHVDRCIILFLRDLSISFAAFPPRLLRPFDCFLLFTTSLPLRILNLHSLSTSTMFFTTLLLAGTASATCMHNLQKFKRQEGEAVKVNTFGYTGLIGPFNWAALEPENEACKTGTNQSPINIGMSTGFNINIA